jgi:hypothetical protein
MIYILSTGFNNIVWFFTYVNSQGVTAPGYNSQGVTAPVYNSQGVTAPGYNSQGVTAPGYTCGPTRRVWGALMSNTGTPLCGSVLKLLLSVV